MANVSKNSRMNYDGVAVCVPVTIPYSRYSLRSAHWFCGRALAELIKVAGIAKDEVDGFCVSSFTLAPDSAVGLMQHLGVSPRWLDHIPMGGASGGVGACHAFVACACWVVGLTAQCTRRRGMAVPWEGAVGSGLVAAIDPCVSVDYRADVAYRVSLLITPIRVQRNDTRNRSAQ